MRIWAAAALALVVCSGATQATPAQKAVHHPAGTVTLVSYSGTVDAQTFDKFTDVISASTDKVIELKLLVERSAKDQDRYYVGVGDGELSISGGDPMDHPCEVLIHGPIGTTADMLTIDGFYLVKNGGMHAAGALSWGLVPVDEATVRLNPKIRIVKKEF